MSKRKGFIWIVVLVGIASAVALAWTFMGSHRGHMLESEGVTSTSYDHADHVGQQYSCGMHPMIIVDEPGQCPICGMDLTPIKATGGAASDKPAVSARSNTGRLPWTRPTFATSRANRRWEWT